MKHQLILLLCLLTVSMVKAQTDLFYESFDGNTSTGGNDDKWNGSIASGSTISTDNDGWSFVTGYGGNYCIRLGSSKKAGSATTPTLTQLSGDGTLTFNAGSWSGDGTTLTLSISGGGTLSATTFALKDSQWETYTVGISGGTPTTKIKFEAPAKNRFFLDEVRVTSEATQPQPQKVVVSSISALRQLESGTPVRLSLSESNQGNIEFVHSSGGTTDAYVRDNGAAVRFTNFLPTDPGWHTTTGGALIGAVDGEYRVTDGMPELVHCATSIADSILCLDHWQTPTPVAVGDLSLLSQDTYRADYIMIEGVSVEREGTQLTATGNGGSIALANPFSTTYNFADDLRGRNYDITGILCTRDGGAATQLCYTEIEEVMPQLALGETRYDNVSTIGMYDDRTVNVTVERRMSTGVWNTLCVPFDILDFAGIVGAARIAQLTGYNASTNSLEFTSTENIQAGVPYLVFPEEDIDDIVLSNVEINSSLTPVTQGTYEMVGIYDPTTLQAGDTQVLFLGDNNTLCYPNVTNDLKAFRAYIRTTTGSSANICVDGVMTDISTAEISQDAPGGRIYNLSGQLMGTQADRLQKGVYVRQGSKIIIK